MQEGERNISYRELLQLVLKLKQNIPVSSGQRVALAMERGIDSAACIYAILMAGACYIPLDIKNPAHRLSYISEDADPALVIGKGTCPKWLNNKIKWLDISSILAASQEQIENQALANMTACSLETDLAAILYTSGSTGAPKGVALSHQAMVNFASWAQATFNLTPHDKIASLAPFYFDLSVFDLFSSMSAGASVHFIPQALTLSPHRLTQWLRHQKISTWYTVPSLLTFLAFKGGLETVELPDLKQILFAGEVFNTHHLIKLSDLLPNVNFYNLYGPTETNVCCYWPVERGRLHSEQAIPIGIPACDSKLVIDNNTGELCVKSMNNFSGYWHKQRLQPAQQRNGFYPTGDIASINEHGEFCYHGRIDRMLKCAGFRVEPAEIETVIRNIPGVINTAVIGIYDPVSGQRPAAVLQLDKNYHLTDIVHTIKTRLPVYMQPVKVKAIETMPLLNNGKFDYRQIEFLFNG